MQRQHKNRSRLRSSHTPYIIHISFHRAIVLPFGLPLSPISQYHFHSTFFGTGFSLCSIDKHKWIRQWFRVFIFYAFCFLFKRNYIQHRNIDYNCFMIHKVVVVRFFVFVCCSHSRLALESFFAGHTSGIYFKRP